MSRVLVIDDEATLCQTLCEILADEGYEAHMAADGREALERVAETSFDCIICDIKMPRMGGLEFLRQFRPAHRNVPFLLMTAFASVETAAEAMRSGATDYLIKPVDFDEMLLRLREVLRETPPAVVAPSGADVAHIDDTEHGFGEIVGTSAAMQTVYQFIRRAGPADCTVLVTGDSGTGKELVACALHRHSPRANGPFMPVNCCCGPSDLIESELFGHVKGAFTGAGDEKLGLFREAEGGTLFLDEVSGLPQSTQGKLLRALDQKEISPVGSAKTLTVDVRILAAANQDLARMVQEGDFREDLFFRLSVVPLDLPPLRQRREDIPLLVAHFVEWFAARLKRPMPQVQPEALEMMSNYRWPGNVRELKNIIERTLIMNPDNQLRAADLPSEMMLDIVADEDPVNLKNATRRFEQCYVEAAVRRADGDKALAAKRLGIALSSLYRKLDEPVNHVNRT